MKMISGLSRRRSLFLAVFLGLRDRSFILLPGLILTASIAAFSLFIEHILGITVLNPLLIAVFLGMGIQNFWGTPTRFRSGIRFSMKQILRLAVILLGLKLSLDRVW